MGRVLFCQLKCHRNKIIRERSLCTPTLDTQCVHIQAVGMERLTLLGRVTSTRVVVERLVVDPGQLATAVAHRGKTRSSHSVPAPPTRSSVCTNTHIHVYRQ